MRVRVDYDLCESNGVCAGLVPQVFEVDDDDNMNVLMEEIPPELEGQVRHAVRSCPKTALSLAEERPGPDPAQATAGLLGEVRQGLMPDARWGG